MKINDLQKNVDNVYYEDDFLTLLESHLPILRTSPKTRVYNVTTRQGEKYEGDLYGLLDELNLEKKYHFAIARFNGYSSGADFKKDVETIYVPDLDYISRLKDLYQSVAK